MKMKSVCVFLLILVSLEPMCCQGCWKHEREALLDLKARFFNSSAAFPGQMIQFGFWIDGTDCCQWDRVVCNTTTGRVAELDLSGMRIYSSPRWYLNYLDFQVFEDLKSLGLQGNSIAGCVENEGLRLNNLEVLYLGGNLLDNDASILSCLDGLSSLNSLSLRFNGLNATSFHVLETLSSKLLNLEVLDISGNYLMTNDILPSLGGFKSLKELYLSRIGLDSELHIQDLSSMLINLEVLDMSWNNFNESDVVSPLSGFSSLKSLTLTESHLTPRSIRGISKLSSLEILGLSGNYLNNSILWSPGRCQHLKSLDLSYNNLKGSLDISGLFELKKLEELNLRYNELEGSLPSSFGNMTSLRKLELSHNHFSGKIGSNLASLTSLEYLDIAENLFEVPISFTPFANLSNLKFIYGNGNKFILDSHPSLQTWVPKFQLQGLTLSSPKTETNSLPLPNFLLYQYNLTHLELTSLKLEGEFPSWLLENNTKMEVLVLRKCSFTGTFRLPSHPLLKMEAIDVSDNAMVDEVITNNISSIFPNLMCLNLSSNKIYGSLPGEFGQMNSLILLDLSDNYFHGEILKNISGTGSLLHYLYLSRNKLDGIKFSTLSTLNYLEHLFMDGNSLSGIIPNSFFNASPSLVALDISNNHFVGKLPSEIANMSRLMELSMSNNLLEGSIPTNFVESPSLVYQDLSKNNLTGYVPSFVNSSLSSLHLNNNRLSGLTKKMFSKRNFFFVMLDLSYNEITGSIHDMIQDLASTGLYILLLKGNRFTGEIPKQLCQLRDLTMLDLSHNNFSGPIPSCLGKMPFDDKKTELLEWIFKRIYVFGYYLYEEAERTIMVEKADFTTKKIAYTYFGDILSYMTGIDLSCNKLNGNIPFELGNLTTIRALNLSHNYLTGKIPPAFSCLVQIESMDLSFNNLNGNIPPQLTELTSLEVFSVAHNNLSGAIPDRKNQFITFDESSYEDNPFLCGPPLPENCTAYIEQPSTIFPNGSYTDGDNSDSMLDMYFFWVSFGVSYTSVLLVIAACLYINPYWRRVWFYYIKLVITNCYYFIEDNLCKFLNIGNV